MTYKVNVIRIVSLVITFGAALFLAVAQGLFQAELLGAGLESSGYIIYQMLPWLAAASLAYFVPAFVACSRKPSAAVPVFILNLFLGWTLVGWVAALVWASAGRRELQYA